MKSITIPSGVTSLGHSINDYNPALRYVDFSENANMTDMDISRSNWGPIHGISENVLVYLPLGHTGSDKNCVTRASAEDGFVCSDYVIAEGADIEIPHSFTAESATYERALAANDAYTVCLPYAPPAISGVKYFKPVSIEGGTLLFTREASPAANTPYLVVTSLAADGFSTTNTLVEKTIMTDVGIEGGYKMVGTLQNISHDQTVDAGAYLLQDGNQWQQATSATSASVNIPAFRAYIVAAGGSGARTLLSNLGETTDVEYLRVADNDGTEQWFDLNGRRMARPAQKGIYIRNGKKTIK